MNILYDYEIQVNQRFGGVSKYFYEIISRIRNYDNTNIDLPVILPKSYDISRITGKKSFNYPYKIAKYISILNSFYLDTILKQKKYDVIHQTQYGYFFPSSISSKVCITIHDMIWEKFPETDPDGSRAREKKRCIERADKIIAISETTKKDLLEIYPNIDEKKITVIHHGTSYIGSTTIEKKDWVPDEYVLYVGTRNEYKNFKVFVDAMVKLIKKGSNIFAVCTGYKGFTEDELTWMVDSETGVDYSAYFIQKKCSDDDMIMLYQYAKCFVFPSKYEGFGMPILEAFANNCPAIISDISVFHEVAGDAGIYFDPDNSMSLFSAINRVAYSEDVSLEYKNRGRSRIKDFSWDKCAQETYKVYKEMTKSL